MKTKQHTIGTIYEGGLGDVLLANRFGAAIREKYPDSFITMYLNTEGNPSSSKLLKKLFPSFYDEVIVIPCRKDKNYKIKTQFGEEIYPAALENIPDEYLTQYQSNNLCYNLHIDGLEWLNHDYDWLRYYYYFPKPQTEVSCPFFQLNEKYALCHLYARPNSPYNLEQWYAIELIKKISQFIHVVIITMPEHRDFYKSLNTPNVSITTPDIEGCFALAKNCSFFIGIDSGIRYIPYHYSKPVFVFSKYCSQYGQVAPSHLIRWLIFQKNVFPMHFDISFVTKTMQNLLQNPAVALFPEYSDTINHTIVDRSKLKL